MAVGDRRQPANLGSFYQYGRPLPVRVQLHRAPGKNDL